MVYSIGKCVFLVEQWVQSGTGTGTAIQLHGSADVANCVRHFPTDTIPVLSRWWGLSAPETLRATQAVA
jgi:hypothetical protein